jgi:four helix bundle protein
VSDFRKLQVWRKAHALAINAHRAAGRMRGQHHAAFRNQIIRSAMSVPTNIVEGRAQKTEASFARFLRIALASLSELEYHLVLARDIRALPTGEYHSLSSQAVEVRRMLHGLLNRLRAVDSPKGGKEGQQAVS